MPTYTRSQLDKLGNTLIYLCNNIEAPSKTHLLKLIFIIEEFSIRKYGIPFFNLRFDLWKLGPISRDLYIELTSEPNLLADYIIKEGTSERSKISAKKEFSDDEFNDNEIKLLEEVVKRFKYCTAKELINYTHKKNSPWFNSAQKHGILDALEAGDINSTDLEIDLSETIQDDKIKLELYNSFKDFMTQSKYLKS